MQVASPQQNNQTTPDALTPETKTLSKPYLGIQKPTVLGVLPYI